MRITLMAVAMVAMVACGGTSDRNPFGSVVPATTAPTVAESDELPLSQTAIDAPPADSSTQTSLTDMRSGMDSDDMSDLNDAMADLDGLLADLERVMGEMEASFEQGEE